MWEQVGVYSVDASLLRSLPADAQALTVCELAPLENGAVKL